MKFPVGCLIGALLMPAAIAQQKIADDAAPDAVVLDAQIASLAKLREQKKTEYFLQARNEIEHPVESPGAAGNYVIECMRKVQYEGKEGGNVDFSEWKKKNRDLLSNHDFEQASNLHLRYLALTLKRATLDSAESVQQEVWNYLAILNQSLELVGGVVRDPAQVKINVYDEKTQSMSGSIVGEIENLKLASAANTRGYVQELLNGSVNAGLVAQALKLNQLLVNIPDWEMVPGNFSGIMEQDIRTYLRKKMDPRLVSTWDYEITYLDALAKIKKDDTAVAQFQMETLPRLRWKQAKDVAVIGMPNRALTMKIALAKQYPQHPDFDQWTTEIGTELKRRKATVPPKNANVTAPPATTSEAPTPGFAPAAPTP